MECSVSALTGSPATRRLSTTDTRRTASELTLSCALSSMVRVSTIARETPKTAITTRTTASVDWIRRRRMPRCCQLFSKRKPTPRTVAM